MGYKDREGEHEYTQTLLGDDELSLGDSIRSEVSLNQSPIRYRRLWLLCISIAFFATTLSLGSFILSRQSLSETKIARPAVLQDDYVLDRSWDLLAPPRIREFAWTLEEIEFNPDGVYRPMLLINNQFPGPLIEANEDDTIVVTVNNNMSTSTSIHWHGIFQNGTNYMDGTVGITQCSIPPGASFKYEFTLTGQHGTYWYHAHQGAQASDGLAGPLIIHGRDEPQAQMLNYTVDRIIMLSDHYHHLTTSLTRQYLAPDMENTEPVPDGALINGQAVRSCDNVAGRKCDNTTKIYPQFLFESGQSQRLRIINTGAFAEFQFQIDEHEMAVVEADGTDIVPVYYHRLNIAPAQRYSVVIHADQTHRTSFRMRARMVVDCFAYDNPVMVKDVEAIVDYGSRQTTLPDSIDWTERLDVECRDTNTTELVPVQVVEAPAIPDKFFYLRTNFRIGDYRLSRGAINDSSWQTNITSPTLSRFINTHPEGLTDSGTSSKFIDNTLFSSKEFTIQTSGIQVIDILIHNLDDGTHPMHLHGYKHFVLASGKGYPPRKSLLDGVSRETVQPLYDNLDLSNPLRRDTTSVEAFGWTLIRFVADNPGAWAFHCHIAWHSEAGLMMQFITRSDQLAEMTLPASNVRLCQAPETELRKGMAPADEQYYAEAIEGSVRSGTGCEGESARACSYDE